MIDTHCHLTYEPLASQLDAVLERRRLAGVDRMISIGTSFEDAAKSIALSTRFSHVFSSVGIHPHLAGRGGLTALSSTRPSGRCWPTPMSWPWAKWGSTATTPNRPWRINAASFSGNWNWPQLNDQGHHHP